MVLDVCSALPADESTLRQAMMRTHDWAKRAKKAHSRVDDQALFGIVQGEGFRTSAFGICCKNC